MWKFFSYVPTIIALLILAVLLFVNAGKKRSRRIFAITAITIMLWLISLAIADTTNNIQAALFFVKQAVFFATLIPLTFFLFALSFGRDDLGKIFRPLVLVYCLPPIIIAVLAYSSSMVQTVRIESWGAVLDKTGYLYSIHSALSFVYFMAGFVVLILKRKKVDALTRNQINLILLGSGTAYTANLISGTVLAQSGVQGPAILLGTFSIVVFAAVVSFAIIKGRLFDIRLAAVRVVTFVLSVVTLGVLYAFAVYNLADQFLFRTIITTKQSQQLFNIIAALVLAFTFPTIRRFFEKITDRVFYRDRYDPQQLVSDIGRVLASEILLEQLSSKVLAIIDSQMRLATSNIVVMGEDGIFYQTHADKIQQLYHAPELAKFNKGTTIADELIDASKREILERHNVRAVFPLRTKESFVGYLLLGEKQSGDIFSTQDVQTLQIISDELAIAINNARSYQEIQRFNETLREKIRLATAELRHANSELKELDKAKDEFISMASHQLRTPLTAVRGYTSMVMEGDFGKVSKEQKETLKQSFDAATRMTRLVDDLLNVSRIQSGKFKIERTEVDLNKVLPEEVSMLGTAAEMKHVTINFHEPKSPVPLLQIDEGKTRQCLMNLMDNAIYYSSTAEGGGKVDVYLEADADWVSFKVKDNGIGVPKAEQAKLFQKFYRAPNAQKTRPDGTGLGLFLVGRVTKDQGGEIIFESEEGKGSTFGFKLPVKAAGEDLSVAGAEAEVKSVGTMK